MRVYPKYRAVRIFELLCDPQNLLNNLRCIVSETLSAEDMCAIEMLDRNCRLVKDQVFLWKDNRSREDLWDSDGVFAPA